MVTLGAAMGLWYAWLCGSGVAVNCNHRVCGNMAGNDPCVHGQGAECEGSAACYAIADGCVIHRS